MKTTAVTVLASLAFFFAGNVWVFLQASLFVQFFYETRMVALTHAFTLGWVSLMIVAVLRQLAQFAFGLNMARAGFLGPAVALWIPGVLTMIVGFAAGSYVLGAIGTSIITAAAALFLFVMWTSFRGVRRDKPHNHLTAALVYLGAAAVLGEWMALSKGFDLPLPAPFHRVLFAHIHLAGAGWAGMMVIAVMSRLFPQSHLRQPRQALCRFAAFNIGLAGLVIGLLYGGDWYSWFGILLALACFWYAAAFIPVLIEFRAAGERSSWFLITAWSALALTASMGAWFCLSSTPDTQAQFVYGFVYMFGWLTVMIFGMLYRIIPSLLSKLLTSRGVTTPAGLKQRFADARRQTVVYAALVLGLIVSSAGILSENAGAFRFGWACWMLGVAVFAESLARIAFFVKRKLNLAAAG